MPLPPDKKEEYAALGPLLSAILDQETCISDDEIADRFAAYAGTLEAQDQARVIRQAEVFQQYKSAARRSLQARASIDPMGEWQARADMDHFRAAASTLVSYSGVPDGIAALQKAKTLEAFAALLPDAALDQTYGRGIKHSRFPLIWAMHAQSSTLERVQLMLKLGVGIDQTTHKGETILHAMAAMNRKGKVRLAILRLLIFKGANLHARTSRGETPLHIAIDRGSVEDVGYFLTVGARVEENDFRSGCRVSAKLRLLLDHCRDNPGQLTQAAKVAGWLRGEIAATKAHLAELAAGKPGAEFYQKIVGNLEASLDMLRQLPSYAAPDGQTKLSWSAEPAAFIAVRDAPDLESYRAALDRVDIKSYPRNRGDQPIYWPLLAKSDRATRLWLMISAGLDVKNSPRDGGGLHKLAAQRNKDSEELEQLVNMLYQAGANLEERDYKNETPLTIAVKEGGQQEVAALLKVGSDPNVTSASRSWNQKRDDLCQTPLLFMAAHEPKKFKLLLSHGANPCKSKENGQSLLDYLQSELTCEEKTAKRKSMSKSLERKVKQLIRGYSTSLKMLADL